MWYKHSRLNETCDTLQPSAWFANYLPDCINKTLPTQFQYQNLVIRCIPSNFYIRLYLEDHKGVDSDPYIDYGRPSQLAYIFIPIEIKDKLTKKHWKSQFCVGSFPLPLYTGILTYRHVARSFVPKLVTKIGLNHSIDISNGPRVRLDLSEWGSLVLCCQTLHRGVSFKLKAALSLSDGSTTKLRRVKCSLLDFLKLQGITLNQAVHHSRYACYFLRDACRQGRRQKIQRNKARARRSLSKLKTTLPAQQADQVKHRLISDTSGNALYYSGYDILYVLDSYMDSLVKGRASHEAEHIGSRIVCTWSMSVMRCIYSVLQKNFKNFPLQRSNSPFKHRKRRVFKAYKTKTKRTHISSPKDMLVDSLDSLEKTLKEMAIKMIDAIHEMMSLNPLSQYLDQTNILSEYVHLRKISLKFVGGGSSPTSNIRDVPTSAFGRICPLFTIEGNMAGSINQLAQGARSQPDGELQSLLQMVNPTQPNREQFVLINSVDLDNHSICVHPPIWRRSEFSYLPRFVVQERSEFRTRDINKINIFSIQSGGFLAPQVNLTPFLFNDDPARCLMGANMQRQAVASLSRQKSIVSTGMDSSLASLNGNSVYSLTEGIVTYVAPTNLTIRDMFNREVSYCFPLTSGNQRQVRYFYPVVWEGERVFPGQLLVDTQGISNGELSLGQNLLLAYASWHGYTYEDSILINERLVHERTLSSVSLEQQEIFLYPRDSLTTYIPGQTPRNVCFLNELGLASLGSTINIDTVIIGKTAVIYESIIPRDDPGVLDSPIGFLHGRMYLAGRKRLAYANYSLSGHPYLSGVLLYLGLLFMKEPAMEVEDWPFFRCIIGKFRPIETGDKLCGRHGNKGVISAVWPQSDLPYTLEGLVPDILVSPLGVPSRMNLGQILETLLGLTGLFLDSRWKVSSEVANDYGTQYKRNLIYHKLQAVKDYTNYKTLFNPYCPGKTLLRDGRTGHLMLGGSVIGVSYLCKLIHLVQDKFRARSQSIYSELTLQPVKGRLQRGGQRFGEMEVWALEAFGASYELRDLVTLKSDGIKYRRSAYMLGYLDQQLDHSKRGLPECWYFLVKNLNSLGIEIYR